MAITETHIHADFVSGARELAARSGGRLYLSDEGPAEWKYAYAEEAGAILVRDGDVVQLGNVTVEALHTPGHTPEHISFLLPTRAPLWSRWASLAGILCSWVTWGVPTCWRGPPEFAGAMEVGARQLFGSLQRFKQLPDYLQVWPAHGAGSACGKSLGAVPQSTVGYEKRSNWALQITEEAEFVRQALEGQPEPPAYFAQMKRINKEGPPPRPESGVTSLSPGRLEHALREGTPVVDARPAAEYAARHVAGTINIPWGRDFLSWAGWLLPYDRPCGLVAPDSDLLRVREELQLIGLDRVTGYWTPRSLRVSEVDGLKRQSASELAVMITRSRVGNGAHGNSVVLLDVRTPAEHAAGRIPGSLNIPLYQLQARLGEVPREQPVVVYCAAGSRSPVAASILHGHGWRDVTELYDGFDAWQARGCSVERSGIETANRIEAPAIMAAGSPG